MKYNEFIFINDNFHPVFDLENETEDNKWSLFIPNDKFRDVLSSVIDSFDLNLHKNSVWLQGTYGTGKSHATAVIKHLLCDKDVSVFDLGDNKLTGKLNNFRKKNNVLPIVLKGTSTINSPKEFRATIQIAVKNVLKNKGWNINISSDFDHMIKLVKNNQFNSEDFKETILAAFPEDEILKRLEYEETEILMALNEILLNKGLFSYNKVGIVDWLSEVRDKLKEEYDIDYLMIFWDEFTGALTKTNADEILLDIQNIAEAKNKGISLFIVSHRVRSNQNFINEHVNKVMDRFEQKMYSMETIATYELMEKSIKKDYEIWSEIKNRYVNTINPLISKIAKNEDSHIKKAIENLYPIHPYTAYLATFIAQEIGSTERSIFKFLHDDGEKGFKQFINDYDVDDRRFLTAEYLWDFFYDDFHKREEEKSSSVINKYKARHNSFKDLNEEYMVVFKVILLLNILYKIANVEEGSLAIPSRENINNVFVGSIYEDKVDDVLNYISKEGIITETPDHLFELTSNGLPEKQVNAEVKKLRNKYNNITKILNPKLKDISDNIKDKTLRDVEIQILDASLDESGLKRKLEKGLFKKNGRLHIIFFLCNNFNEFSKLKSNINNIKSIKTYDDKGLLDNIILIISEATFIEDDINKFFKYKARAIIANEHKFSEDALLNEKHADGIVDNWIRQIKTSIVTWYLNEEGGRGELNSFIKKINVDLSKKIYYKGLENINIIAKNINLWTVKKNTPSLIEKCVASKNLSTLQMDLKGISAKSLFIFENNNEELIINEKLLLKDNVSDTHPLKLMQDFVDNALSKKQSGGIFNIGDVLEPLTDYPYGLYRNIVNTVALCFVLRKYINKFYFKGTSVEESRMIHIVDNLFKYWDTGKGKEKLDIRFGSEIEKKFIDLIDEVFNFNLDSQEKSIDKIRWKIREWMKFNKFPLWLFKYSDNVNDSLINAINSLYGIINSNNVTDESIEKCYNEIFVSKIDFQLVIRENSFDLFRNFVNTFATNADSDFSQESISDIWNFIVKSMPEINDNWDENEIKNKCYDEIIRIKNIRIIKEKVNKLINVISNIFNFNCEENTIESVGLNMDMWVKSNKIPLWLFKYSNNFKSNAINDVIDKLVYLIKYRSTISPETISESYDKIYVVKEDLSLLIKEDFDDLIKNFIFDIDSDLSKNDFLQIKEKFMKELTVDIYLLNENEVKGKIRRIIADIITVKPPSPSGAKEENIIDKVNKSEASLVKEAIINMLKENKEIREQFNEYFERVNNGK